MCKTTHFDLERGLRGRLREFAGPGERSGEKDHPAPSSFSPLLSPGPSHLTSYPLPPFKPARCEGLQDAQRRSLAAHERRATPHPTPRACAQMFTDVHECASKTRNDKTNPF